MRVFPPNRQRQRVSRNFGFPDYVELDVIFRLKRLRDETEIFRRVVGTVIRAVSEERSVAHRIVFVKNDLPGCQVVMCKEHFSVRGDDHLRHGRQPDEGEIRARRHQRDAQHDQDEEGAVERVQRKTTLA